MDMQAAIKQLQGTDTVMVGIQARHTEMFKDKLSGLIAFVNDWTRRRGEKP